MATFTKRKLSGSTDGLGIKIAQTATAGTAIHTAVAGTTAGTYDEIWLFVYNGHTANVVLTIEFGGATAPDQNIICTCAAKSGLQLAIPGFILQNGATVKAFAATANVIVVYGFVNTTVD
jgi:hypothetical protein